MGRYKYDHGDTCPYKTRTDTIKSYQPRYTLATTLPLCYRHYIDFFLHSSQSRRCISFADIVSFLIAPRLTRHTHWPKTKHASTFHYAFVSLCIRYKFSCIHFAISLLIQEIMDSSPKREVTRTLLIGFVDVFLSHAFSADLTVFIKDLFR